MVVAATGFFDGVHAGHRAVLQVLKDTAREEGEESAVVTFWPHPRNVLQQDASSFRLLNTIDEKKALIRAFGIDQIHVIPFTRDFSQLSTTEFMREYLVDRFRVDTLIIGYDHRLGRSSTASREELAAIAAGVGLRTRIVEEVHCDDRKVSSTQIRNLLAAGDVCSAGQMLGYRYTLHGVVVSGNMLGRTLGFPTANMQLYEPLKVVPADGVYAVGVEVLGQRFGGMCNIGTRPTVDKGNARTIETHIFDFHDDIYGLDIRIDFVGRIRDERCFPSVGELRSQMTRDSLTARHMLASC
ncbi:MAG TPA: bifunctional riboflavin kinase/FAD synthetase [Candidatus Coprenecus pullistercoris]|nr:bifunctional riboflavin kinase/FAD synthetase [Candidatus Coprenecus pullistercoris]